MGIGGGGAGLVFRARGVERGVEKFLITEESKINSQIFSEISIQYMYIYIIYDKFYQ